MKIKKSENYKADLHFVKNYHDNYFLIVYNYQRHVLLCYMIEYFNSIFISQAASY